MGIPFTIFKDNKEKQIISGRFKQNIKTTERKDNSIGKPFGNTKEKIQGLTKTYKESSNNNNNIKQNCENSLSIIINPKEIALVDVIMSELSVINSSCCSNDQVHIINHIITEYTELSNYLLDSDKVDEFIKVTEWISSQIGNVIEIFYPHLRYVFIIKPLSDFKKTLSETNNPYAFNYYVSFIDPTIKEHKKNE